MARKRVVSRTIATTIATAMVTNITESSVEYRTVTLSGAYTDMAKLDKAVRKAVETEPNIKFACVTETHRDEALYVMDEDMFLQFATKSDKKPVKEAEAEA